ncbi:MAG TPA: GNAT family N-acetyltransferase [Casimicrobiaceae bacterium]|nr:GNAT family N-acetyltransferase [Casimicrobiaceae bacterium]
MSAEIPVVIRDARVPMEIPLVRALFDEYAASLGVDLSFQDFARELAELPGGYAAPRGCLLVADIGGEIVGCVALRALAADEPQGEIKRLYLRPAARGRGLGRDLVQAVITRARSLGYRMLKLDTLASMQSARTLYASLGFRACAPYYRNPLPGTSYMDLALDVRD